MNWIDAKITPDEMSVIICAGYDRVHRGFYSNGSYWSADGRLRKISPRKASSAAYAIMGERRFSFDRRFARVLPMLT